MLPSIGTSIRKGSPQRLAGLRAKARERDSSAHSRQFDLLILCARIGFNP
jgi:hypothetical protein